MLFIGPSVCTAFAWQKDDSACFFLKTKFDTKTPVWLWEAGADASSTGGGIDFCYNVPSNVSVGRSAVATAPRGALVPTNNTDATDAAGKGITCNGATDPPECADKFATVECKTEKVRAECPILCKHCFELAPKTAFQCKAAWPSETYAARWSEHCFGSGPAFWGMSTDCRVAWPAATAEAAVKQCRSLDPTCMLFDAERAGCGSRHTSSVTSRNSSSVTSRNASSVAPVPINNTDTTDASGKGNTSLSVSPTVSATADGSTAAAANDNADGSTTPSTTLIVLIVLPLLAVAVAVGVGLFIIVRRRQTNAVLRQLTAGASRTRRKADDTRQKTDGKQKTGADTPTDAEPEYGSVITVNSTRAEQADTLYTVEQTVYQDTQDATLYTTDEAQQGCQGVVILNPSYAHEADESVHLAPVTAGQIFANKEMIEDTPQERDFGLKLQHRM